MLDKLHLASHQHRTLDEVGSLLSGRFGSYSITGTRYYQEVISFADKSNQHLITVGLEPRFPSAYPLKIEVNPSRFASYSDLCELVGLLTDPTEAGIQRIDHFVDIEVSLIQVHESLIFPRKKCREVYKDGYTISGFYLGRHPEILGVYDKGLEMKLDKTLTRLELRQYGKKTPIQLLSELPNLTKYDPFTRLEFVEVDTYSVNGDRNKRKVAEFKGLVDAYGVQAAYKRTNKHSNFRRDYGKCLRPNRAIPDLNDIYQRNVNDFVKGESYGFRKAN